MEDVKEFQEPKYHIGDEIIYISRGSFGATCVAIVKSIHGSAIIHEGQAAGQWVYNGNIVEDDVLKLFTKN